ncbi:hypothetical protein BCR34DRAFT_597283 [Clohesyomyces aquaticus]|uniref:Uncharacterized protein n=1 Tax=Clohesyomyces aquaticus TaxID=1231657 RepID=A0A1Y2A2Z1_9PLEO|nr:hypothetical protein BCR34DRAFT_597283 [Clohesyomyces aquaticus]
MPSANPAASYTVDVSPDDPLRAVLELMEGARRELEFTGVMLAAGNNRAVRACMRAARQLTQGVSRRLAEYNDRADQGLTVVATEVEVLIMQLASANDGADRRLEAEGPITATTVPAPSTQTNRPPTPVSGHQIGTYPSFNPFRNPRNGIENRPANTTRFGDPSPISDAQTRVPGVRFSFMADNPFRNFITLPELEATMTTPPSPPANRPRAGSHLQPPIPERTNRTTHQAIRERFAELMTTFENLDRLRLNTTPTSAPSSRIPQHITSRDRIRASRRDLPYANGPWTLPPLAAPSAPTSERWENDVERVSQLRRRLRRVSIPFGERQWLYSRGGVTRADIMVGRSAERRLPCSQRRGIRNRHAEKMDEDEEQELGWYVAGWKDGVEKKYLRVPYVAFY